VATAEVDIANSALAKLGAPLIEALTDTVRAAVLCNERYPILRKKLLASHPWNFATKRVSLAATADEPIFEYDMEFALPTGCLRVLDTDLSEGEEWEIENGVSNGRVLLCNADAVKIKYIKDITDVTLFPPHFEECLALLLAADISYAITQNNTVKQDMWSAYKNEVREARSIDAQEAQKSALDTNPWIDVRW